MGELRLFEWEKSQGKDLSTHKVFVGHTGAIYTIRFSPNGTHLATGGNDALVGLWNVPFMVCTATISRRTKFIRSVSYSYDSKLIACCSEEDGIDLANAETGECVGTVNLTKGARYASSGGGNADEIAFHPKGYFLACARGEPSGSSSMSSSQVPQVSVAKISS